MTVKTGWQIALCFMLAGALSVAGQDMGRTPDQTAKSFKVPEGFSVSVFAAEPHLRQPIGFCFDDRGRIWVAENYSYPSWNPTGEDRILIFEDADGDGRFDKRTVFYDKLNYVTGLEVGFGGVWVISPPNLLFIPDKDGDDRPDAEPIVELDGFGHQGVHNLVNGCTWGPDGWLYGGHGGSSSGKIGRPAAPDDRRVFFDGGVWRYHPTRKVFESFMEGTTNPWGVDFDDYGMAFISNSVTPHLYHVIQGAHVERRRESPNSRYAYAVIDSIADHKHWVGGKWEDSRGGAAEQTAKQIVLGGGHAHSGCMVYLGDNWPDRYRGTIFMINIHGDRMNNDLPRRRGSGFVASHGQDLLTSGDPWFMGLQAKYGPDGAVYVSDWYDTGECHTRKPETAKGRIYRVSYQTVQTPRPRVDVSGRSEAELVELQLHKNEWWGRRARRVLQERGPHQEAHRALRAILRDNRDVTRRLRAIWALHVSGGASAPFLRELLKDDSEYVRAWAVQFLAEDKQPTEEVLAQFERMAIEDPSPLVRIYLASAMIRLPVQRRWAVMEALLAHAEDVADANLPLMYWYALEPMAVADARRALALVAKGRMPRLREFVTRRIAEKAR